MSVLCSVLQSSTRTDTFDRAGETFSIDTSITAYRIENGRQYHSFREGVYCECCAGDNISPGLISLGAPNDDRQNENLDIR